MDDRIAEIRPEDFRRAWPNALVNAMEVAHAVLEKAERLIGQIQLLLESVPPALDVARSSLQATSARHLDAIERSADASREMLQAAAHDVRSELLAEVRQATQDFRATCQREMDRLDARREDVTNAKCALQAEEARVRRELNEARRELTTAQVAFLRRHLKGLSWHHRLLPGGLSDAELERAMAKTT